jgi:HEAT repeat protein
MAREQDEPVWRGVMSAIMGDANEESAQVALLAINHRWPDIRVLGCQYVARHGRPEQGPWLLPLLNDTDPRVKLAAIEAAGRCHNPALIEGVPHPDQAGHPQGLVPLLADPDPRLRTATAISLSQLGDPRGMQELVRMSYHESPAVREQFVRHMGASGRTRFVEHLIRMGHTEQNPNVQRSILASLEQLVPGDARPRNLAETASLNEQLTQWVAWWQQQSQIH